MNLIEWLLSEKIAHHARQAENIIRLLKLGELHAEQKYDEIKARAVLYREWRWSGENVRVAAAAAIDGKLAPKRLISTEMGDR